MKYYSHRTGKNYSKDIEYALRKGLVDTDDVVMLSREFAQWAPSLIDIARKKNMEYASVGVLSRNDLIQIVSECFLIAWRRVNWTRINNIPVEERRAAIWGFLKKNIELDFNRKIRYVKDGIKVPVREQFEYSDTKDTTTALFDAITGLFPQLKLEMETAHVQEEDTSWNNHKLIEVLQSHFRKHVKNDKQIFILERSLGIDGPRLSTKAIAERLNTSESSVKVTKNRALKKLKNEESKRDLAFSLDGYLVETGADILKYLK